MPSPWWMKSKNPPIGVSVLPSAIDQSIVKREGESASASFGPSETNDDLADVAAAQEMLKCVLDESLARGGDFYPPMRFGLA
jgi:hypothetical protein